MIVLGISGWKKSGKDTAAEFLVSDCGYRRVSFADPLKRQSAEIYGIDLESMFDQNKKEKPILSMPVRTEDDFSKNLLTFMFKEFRTEAGDIAEYLFIDNGGFVFDLKTQEQLYWTPRAILIMEGSVKRSVDSAHWVNKAADMISDLHVMAGHQRFVIADLRYKSEMKQLEQRFGDNFVSLRVNRFWRSDSVDPSERDLDDYPFKYKIENTSTIDHFYNALINLEKIYER
jgi:hypothetical protein